MIKKTGMRRLAQRGVVVVVAAGFATGLMASVSAYAASSAATHTTLTSEVKQIGGREVILYTAAVVGDDGAPATGAVTLTEQGRNLAGAALDSEGKAEIRADGLAVGDHTLSAVYSGDGKHATSQSETLAVHPQATATPTFGLTINPTTLTIAAVGDSGTMVATITPVNSFTGFISLSCSGPPTNTGNPGGTSLPVGVACTFAPANLQVTAPTANNTTGVTGATMTLTTSTGQQTVAGQDGGNHSNTHGVGSPMMLAILLPGVVGLGFLGRKRNLFGGVTLLVMVGAIGVVGTTSCAARYNYLNHGPTFAGTPSGTYTLTITAQTSNGVTASSQSQTLTLVVK